jgi:hypothetical protein
MNIISVLLIGINCHTREEDLNRMISNHSYRKAKINNKIGELQEVRSNWY